GARALSGDRASPRLGEPDARGRRRLLRRRTHERPRHPALDRRPRPQRDQDEAPARLLRRRRRSRPRGLRPRVVRGFREVPMTLALRLTRPRWIAALLLTATNALAGPPPALRTRNVVVIVTDGLRWQEVFRGAE